MSWACGWCIAFNDECCQGKIVGCSHGKRCEVNQKEIKAQTARAAQQALGEVRRSRQEAEMTGRIRKAWEQLDEATNEIVQITHMPEGETKSRLAALAKAKAMGKAEILAILMPAPLNTPEAISQEAGRRWQHRRNALAYETPGLRMVAATVLDDVGDGTERVS